MQVQTLVPKTAGKRLDIGIVRRLAGSTEHQGYFVLPHPQVRVTSLVTVDPSRVHRCNKSLRIHNRIIQLAKLYVMRHIWRLNLFRRIY